MKKNFFNILLAFILFSNIYCDIPVHCEANDIYGDWTIYIYNKKFDPSLTDIKTTCGHGFPNKVTLNIGDVDDYPEGKTKKLKINLSDDFNVYKNGKKVGNWTMIYDQGMLIHYKKKIINANFKYFKENMNEEFLSNCNKITLGWIISEKDINEDWSCVYGFKNDIEKKMNFLQKNNNKGKKEKKEKKGKKINKNNKKDPKELANLIKYDDLSEMVDEINNANLTWKAGIIDKYKGMSLLQMRNSMGLNKGKNKIEIENQNNEKNLKNKNFNNLSPSKGFSMLETEKKSDTYLKFMENFKKNTNDPETLKILEENELKQKQEEQLKNEENNNNNDGKEKDSQYVTDPDEILKYINSTLDEMDENKLPKNWDWRNVGGENFVPEPFEQGNCGSCYTLATIFSLESRLRIKTLNKDKTKFSVQFPLACNFYSEGCDGGYPILVGKFFHEFEIVPEECFEYTQSTNQCSNVCDYTKYPKKYYVGDYGYIGGYYGALNEVLMMKEIRARGPIPGNIIVPLSFNVYKSGIYSEKPLKKNSGKFNKTSMIENEIDYLKVEHSTTIVGYGEENGVKYWIGMNTWGNSWGENGFYKILRGENEMNIETMGDYFNIEITDRNNTNTNN